MNRRDFAKTIAGGAGTLMAPGLLRAAGETGLQMPSSLKGYETLIARDPRAAAVQWFREARFGLFLHYGLYSLLERGEWVMFANKIHVR